MVRFEDLQTLWQKQPSRAATPKQAAELTSAFRRYGRRHDLLYLTKLLLVALQMAFLATVLRHRPQVLFGACLAVFCSLLFLVRDWRAQRAVARLNFDDPSMEFLRHALERLNALRNPFRYREFYIAIGGAFVGMNLMIDGPWTAHLPTLAMPYLMYRLCRFIRDRRFARECEPLVHRLTAVLSTLEAV
jgi:hypothetical protein